MVYVQGKRISSEAQVRKRVREAHHQLDRDYRRGLECAGLIAISITKLMNPAGGRPRFANWRDLDALLLRASHEFIARHEKHWHNGDKRTLGALVMYRCGAYVEEAPWFAPAECLSFSYRADIDGERLALARRLRGVLDSGSVVLPGLPRPAPTPRGGFRQPLQSGSPTT